MKFHLQGFVLFSKALSDIMNSWERLAHRVLVILDGFPDSLLEAFQTLKLSAQLLHLTIVEFYQNISNVHLEQDPSTVFVSIDFTRFQQSIQIVTGK